MPVVTFRYGAYLCYTEGQTCSEFGLYLQRFNKFLPKQTNVEYGHFRFFRYVSFYKISCFSP